MADKKKASADITGVTKIADGIYSMWIKEKEMASRAKAGQFVSLYCRDGSRLLPRPISICGIDRENGILRLVYRVVGTGTKEFSRLNPGDKIEVMGPLGNGFTQEGSEILVIGGGIGIPPMLELARELSLDGTRKVQIVLGYRDILFLKEEFEPYGTVYISTEDGSAGTKGNVIDAIKENGLCGDMIYACGPTPMLRGIKAYAMEHGITAQISMEERMACGIGACLACVCQSAEQDPHTHVNNKRICKDGPVFYATEVTL